MHFGGFRDLGGVVVYRGVRGSGLGLGLFDLYEFHVFEGRKR